MLQECLRAARVISRCMGEQLAALGLTPVQLDVLDVLREREGIPLHDLRDALCCVGSNVTALVDRMERDGLVERRRDAEDRRVIRLFLGAAGREKLSLLGDPGRCCPVTLDMLSAEERSTLVGLLRKLVSGLGCACPSPGAACSSDSGEENGCERGANGG